MLVPSGIHAKYPIPRNAESPPQSPLFSHFHLKNHPLDSTKTPYLNDPGRGGELGPIRRVGQGDAGGGGTVGSDDAKNISLAAHPVPASDQG